MGEFESSGRAPGAPLGRRIADLRAKRGWTQQQLADRVGISRVAVSNLESGLNHPGERTVALLAGVFHIEPHELVAGTSYPPAKAERLPVVVARHTEVEHQLALFDKDLAWAERVADPAAIPPTWEAVLAALLAGAHDPAERALVKEARRRLANLRRRR
ncbi:helix-turn-helix domain-containing protein [soil metagenome]